MSYDSTEDTREHINKVRAHLYDFRQALELRGLDHDYTKLNSPEKEIFDRVTPLLQTLTYGSNEYDAVLRQMGDALQHHYAHNSHHAEHYDNGIDGMSLLDLVEMMADWKAASERHGDGDFHKSLEINRQRFGVSDQLHSILVNTAREMGW